MNFGSYEFYLRLKNEFYSENNWEIHLLLEKEVRRVAKRLAWQATSDPQLRADAVEDAISHVFIYSIHRFLEDPRAGASDDRGRTNWLYRVTGNSICSTLRRANVRSGIVLRDEDGKPIRIRTSSLDQTDEDGFRPIDVVPGSDPDPLETMAQRQVILDALSALFSMDSVASERLIAAASVMLQKACGFSFSKKMLNSAVAETLQGHTAAENLEHVKRLLRVLELPAELVQPLEDRLAASNPTMNFTTRDVTKAASDVRVRLQKQFPHESARTDASQSPHDDRVVPFKSGNRKDG